MWLLLLLVAVLCFVYVDGGCVPVVVESADVVFLRVPVFVGNGDGARNGRIVSELACLVSEARCECFAWTLAWFRLG